MKILGISCSPRKSGNTTILLEEVLSGAKQEGAEVELFSVAGKNIQPCDGCWSCMEKGSCHIEDDMQSLLQKAAEADGIIFGTPVYLHSMTGQAKVIMDRMVSVRLSNKVGGVVVVAGSLGIIDAVKDLFFNMVVKKMIPANFVAVYANEKGEARKMEQGMKAAYELGREMVQIAALGFKYPRGFRRNHSAFGTHTH